jgi:alanine dehydrogenase
MWRRGGRLPGRRNGQNQLGVRFTANGEDMASGPVSDRDDTLETSSFISEAEVARRLTVPLASEAVRGSFDRLAAGLVREQPRVLLQRDGGYFAALAGLDEQLGIAAVKTYSMIDGALEGMTISVHSLADGRLRAIVEADLLTKLRTAAASGVAATALARAGATSVGIIGCGRQAPFQLEAIRYAVPGIEKAVAWTRRPDQLTEFCERTGAAPAGGAEEAAGCDIVVTATTSPVPVIAGEWLRPGVLVIAIGGDHTGDRELDDRVIDRAGLLVCDSRETSRHEAADFWEPARRGLLEWDDVLELQEVTSGLRPGRSSDDQIVVFKSNGMGAWDLAAVAAVLD